MRVDIAKVTKSSGKDELTMADTEPVYVIEFFETASGYGIGILRGGNLISKTKKPVSVNVTTREGDKATYNASYSAFSIEKNVYSAEAFITAKGGSIFEIKDSYKICADGVDFSRVTKIKAVGTEEIGFSDTITLMCSNDNAQKYDFNYFMPGIVYKDTSFIPTGAPFSTLDCSSIYVCETKCPLPLMMVRNRLTGFTLSLARINPKVEKEGKRFGSIGCVLLNGIGVSYCYPSSDGNFTHDIKEGTSHRYELTINAEKTNGYIEAMTDTYLRAFELTHIDELTGFDIDRFYDDCTEILINGYFEKGSVAGYAFLYSLPNGLPGDYSFQMGFVGQQTGLAYQLIRYGHENGNKECINKGKKIINFWCDICRKSKLPCVWVNADKNTGEVTMFTENGEIYPVFLRCLADGMEGIADAYKYMKSKGTDDKAWLLSLESVADWLCAVQNEDGSFYRAYDSYTGLLSTNETEAKYQCSSKENTPIIIRFLRKMYDIVGSERYKLAALSAAEYSYNEIFSKYGKFIGGTPDNPNAVDKEASVYAMYGFNAAYELSSSDADKIKYAKVAEYAAVCALSWVYLYDIRIKNNIGNELINPFAEGNTSGFSLISCGHSGADCYMSGTYYEYYMMYRRNGNALFKKAALMLQNNTKSVTDFDGRLGYKYKAMCVEATKLCNFTFSSAGGGVWLPWIGFSHMSPITQMREKYACANCAKIKDD